MSGTSKSIKTESGLMVAQGWEVAGEMGSDCKGGEDVLELVAMTVVQLSRYTKYH